MKKLIFIVAFFVSQVGFGQYYTFQVFANQEEIFEETSGNVFQVVEPFHSFLIEHGFFWDALSTNLVLFDDDPSNHIFPMFVVPAQANALENLLINSELVYKYISYNDETYYLLDRMSLKYYEGMTPEFLGIQDGIVQTDNEPLNILFEAFQVDNYQQSVTSPDFYNIRCNGCDIFQLAQEIIDIEIVDNAELLLHEQVLSIDEIEKTNGFIISPNPNKGSFKILLNSNDFIGTQLTIFDALGRKVYDEKLLQTNTIIQLNSISPGIYFARLDNNGKSSLKKFIVKN